MFVFTECREDLHLQPRSARPAVLELLCGESGNHGGRNPLYCQKVQEQGNNRACVCVCEIIQKKRSPGKTDFLFCVVCRFCLFPSTCPSKSIMCSTTLACPRTTPPPYASLTWRQERSTTLPQKSSQRRHCYSCARRLWMAPPR